MKTKILIAIVFLGIGFSLARHTETQYTLVSWTPTSSVAVFFKGECSRYVVTGHPVTDWMCPPSIFKKIKDKVSNYFTKKDYEHSGYFIVNNSSENWSFYVDYPDFKMDISRYQKGDENADFSKWFSKNI